MFGKRWQVLGFLPARPLLLAPVTRFYWYLSTAPVFCSYVQGQVKDGTNHTVYTLNRCRSTEYFFVPIRLRHIVPLGSRPALRLSGLVIPVKVVPCPSFSHIHVNYSCRTGRTLGTDLPNDLSPSAEWSRVAFHLSLSFLFPGTVILYMSASFIAATPSVSWPQRWNETHPVDLYGPISEPAQDSPARADHTRFFWYYLWLLEIWFLTSLAWLMICMGTIFRAHYTPAWLAQQGGHPVVSVLSDREHRTQSALRWTHTHT